MNKLYAVLNKEVANLSVFFTKLHHFHWFCKGPNFLALHAKYEELYDEINELYDEFAERLLAIGGTPASTQKEYLTLTTLKEGVHPTHATDSVNHVIADLKQLASELKDAISIAQDLGDESTADLFISTISSFEKHVWLLSFTQN